MALQDYYDSLIAYNPDTSELVSGATFQVFAVDDSAFATPLVVTEPTSGATIATLTSSAVGVLPDFRVAGDPAQVILKSGAFVTKLTSRLGVFTEAGFDPEQVTAAIAAAPAAEASAAAAAAAASAAEAALATAETGFVPLPIPGQVRQNALTGMVHVPAIPADQDGGAFIQAYINAMEAGAKGSAPLGTGLLFLGERYICTTRIKNEVKAFDWKSSARAKYTTLQNRYGYGGTQIICAIPAGSIGDSYEPFIQIGSRIADVSFFSGVTWQGISIVGRELGSDATTNKTDYPAIDPIRFTRFGWDCDINGLWVRRFLGGIVFDQCYDSAWNDMSVTGCGGLISGTPHYAMTFDNLGPEDDVCNAMKFKSLHLEAVRYAMKFVKARHVEFFGGWKLELNDYFSPKGYDTDLTNAPVYFGATVMEIQFTGGYVMGAHVGKWLSVNVGAVAADVPFVFVSDADRGEGTSGVSFTGTVLTNGMETETVNKRGTRWFKGKNFLLSNLLIDYCTTEAPGIDIQKSVLTGGRIVLGTYGHVSGGSAFPVMLQADSSAHNVSLAVSGGTAKYALVLNGARSAASLAYPPTGIERPVIGGGTSGGGYRGLPGLETVDSAAYIAKYGGGSVPYTTVTIDPTRHANDVLVISFGSNATTISSITVSQNTRGRELVLYNGGSVDLTVTGSSSQDAATIPAGSRKVYRLMSSKWTLAA